MKRMLFQAAKVALAAALLAGCCTPPNLASVGVNLVPQHRDWWCWAATTEMISTYYAHRVDQCQSANFVHGMPPDCCTGCTGNCPGWGSGWGATIADIQNNWTHWNFQYKYTPGSIGWSDLRETISTTPNCKKSPIQAVWWWTGGGGHVVTIYGYAEVGGQQYVSYFNPLPVDCTRSAAGTCSSATGGEDAIRLYSDFVSSASHNWGDSFSEFKYAGP
jgi:hypothetical protein